MPMGWRMAVNANRMGKIAKLVSFVNASSKASAIASQRLFCSRARSVARLKVRTPKSKFAPSEFANTVGCSAKSAARSTVSNGDWLLLGRLVTRRRKIDMVISDQAVTQRLNK